MNNKAFLIQANESIIAKADTSKIAEVFDENYIVHADGKTYQGHAFVERFIKQLHTTFADLKLIDVSILMQAEDSIASQRTIEGTHIKSLKGIPASNKRYIWREMVVSRFANELIAEEWLVSEMLGQMLLHQQPT